MALYQHLYEYNCSPLDSTHSENNMYLQPDDKLKKQYSSISKLNEKKRTSPGLSSCSKARSLETNIDLIREQTQWETCSFQKQIASRVKIKNTNEQNRLHLLNNVMDRQLSAQLHRIMLDEMDLLNIKKKSRSTGLAIPRKSLTGISHSPDNKSDSCLLNVKVKEKDHRSRLSKSAQPSMLNSSNFR